MKLCNMIKLVLTRGLLFIMIMIFSVSCSEKNIQDNKELNEMLSELKVYKKPDRIAQECTKINAKETNGKYSADLIEYSGLVKVCNDQNKVVTLYRLVNGKHEGTFYTYDHEGFLIGKTEYKNDQKNGEFIQLDQSGRIVLKAQFHNDILIQCEGPLCDEFKHINN